MAVHLARRVARRLATVDGDDGAGDVRGKVGTEPKYRVGDLAGLTDPALRGELARLALGLRTGRLEVVGEDRARRQGVDPDALVGIVQGGDLGEADDTGIAGDIAREVGH